MTLHKSADTTAQLHPLLAERWSPRAFNATHQLDDVDATALLEAARWAPSASNSQPWRFLLTHRGDQDFQALSEVLAEGNRTWAPQASALLLVVAQTTDEAGRSRPWALYDTGQAVAALSVQAAANGLHVHQLGGFDADAARHAFDLSDELTPVVVVVIGKLDPKAVLPEPLAAREQAPRTREPLQGLLLSSRRNSRRAA